MRRAAAVIATASALGGVALTASTAASADPAVIDVRIEGRDMTLFEGPLLTDGHRVRASSETVWRICDGTNNRQNPTPGPTPTAASFDAMRTIGRDFDGRWYGGYDDYFVQRFGPDREFEDQYWGILVGGRFTPVGGCQARVRTGEEMLWAYNAFNNRRFLRLAAADDESLGTLSQPPDRIVTVPLGEPLRLGVSSYIGVMGDEPVDLRPQQDIAVLPVATDPSSFFQRIPNPDLLPDPAVTDASGEVELTFDSAGWHRVKAAREGSIGPDAFVRSNRLDVCVEPPPPAPTPCGQLPPDVALRIAPPLPPDDADYPPGIDPPKPRGKAPRLSRPWLLRGLAPRGRFGVRWTILEAGVGVRTWSISSRVAGVRKARWRQRARGGGRRLTARFKLPAGRTHTLRFTVTDRVGRRSQIGVGRAIAPLDDRSRRLRFAGRWRKRSNGSAWLRTVRDGRKGARVRVRLGAGRPTFLLRAPRRAARVELRAAGRGEVFAIARGGRGTLRQVTGRRRKRGGVVELVVRAGEVSVDGVAIQP